MTLEPLGAVLDLHFINLLGQLDIVDAQSPQAVRVQNNLHVAITRQVQVGMVILSLGDDADGIDGVKCALKITSGEGAGDGVLLGSVVAFAVQGFELPHFQ